MRKILLALFIVTLPLASSIAHTDSSSVQVIKQKNSKCFINRKAGEYPSYSIKTAAKEIYKPQSDGIGGAFISESGKYAALSGSEVNLVDIKSGKPEFGIVIINCDSGEKVGYRKGRPTHILEFAKDDKSLRFKDAVDGTTGTLDFSNSETPLP